jgi:hypothetical protein
VQGCCSTRQVRCLRAFGCCWHKVRHWLLSCAARHHRSQPPPGCACLHPWQARRLPTVQLGSCHRVHLLPADWPDMSAATSSHGRHLRAALVPRTLTAGIPRTIISACGISMAAFPATMYWAPKNKAAMQRALASACLCPTGCFAVLAPLPHAVAAARVTADGHETAERDRD